MYRFTRGLAVFGELEPQTPLVHTALYKFQGLGPGGLADGTTPYGGVILDSAALTPQDPGKLSDRNPEPLDCFHDGRQRIAAVWLRDVPIRVIIIRSLNIPVSFGGGKHEHRNSSELPVLLDPTQHLSAGHSGQVPIEKFKIREGAFLLVLEQKMESLLAVLRGRQIPAGLLSASAKGILNQVWVSRIILYHEQANRPDGPHCRFRNTLVGHRLQFTPPGDHVETP